MKSVVRVRGIYRRNAPRGSHAVATMRPIHLARACVLQDPSTSASRAAERAVLGSRKERLRRLLLLDLREQSNGEDADSEAGGLHDEIDFVILIG